MFYTDPVRRPNPLRVLRSTEQIWSDMERKSELFFNENIQIPPKTRLFLEAKALGTVPKPEQIKK